ncbi:MAG: hypothetical protein CVT89_00890 [Candidatus Altiarchaeales archaeon HGW-Altiarchaeales-2]|nr:MAG: hypothetical protein CVT89_00890 [Candidatus Altiarchaeales archaeon HGW-Altiarchaeales-2]
MTSLRSDILEFSENSKMKKILLVGFIGLLIFVLFGFITVQADEIHAKKIYVVDINDAITSATVETIKEAVNEKPDIIILRLNTPGGNLDSTLEIIQIIDNSEIPFVGYVAPKGAHAWSAGTFILLSTHIAAMAPNSIIGSCQPVHIGERNKNFKCGYSSNEGKNENV